METISLKSNARKTLAGLYTNKDSLKLCGTLSRMSVFTDFTVFTSLNMILFIYIRDIIWAFSYFIL